MRMKRETVNAVAENEPAWLQERRLHARNALASAPPLNILHHGLGISTPLEGFEPEECGKGTIDCVIPADVEKAETVQDKRLFTMLTNGRFSHLHTAFCNQFLYLKIPDNTTITTPVLIRKVMGSAAFFEHVFIDVGANCSLSVVDTVEGSGAYHSGGLELFLGEGSSLVFVSNQNLSQNVNNFSVKSAALSRDSTLEWIAVDTGGRLTLSEMRGIMGGRNASLRTKLMAFGSGNQRFDCNVSAVHAAPNTNSLIAQKAVLDRKAKLIVNGLVRIDSEATQSSGRQKEETLLLSADAEAALIPNLEIGTSDVQCSHATTVGQVDSGVLFYMMSRGLDREAATLLLVRGFFEPIMAGIPLKKLQERIMQGVEDRLAERRAA